MASTNSNVRNALAHVRDGQFKALGKSIGVRLYSNLRALRMERDLSKVIPTQQALIPITLRLLAPKDHDRFFKPATAGLGEEDASHRNFMASFHRLGLGRCYVTADEDDLARSIRWFWVPRTMGESGSTSEAPFRRSRAARRS